MFRTQEEWSMENCWWWDKYSLQWHMRSLTDTRMQLKKWKREPLYRHSKLQRSNSIASEVDKDPLEAYRIWCPNATFSMKTPSLRRPTQKIDLGKLKRINLFAGCTTSTEIEWSSMDTAVLHSFDTWSNHRLLRAKIRHSDHIFKRIHIASNNALSWVQWSWMGKGHEQLLLVEGRKSLRRLWRLGLCASLGESQSERSKAGLKGYAIAMSSKRRQKRLNGNAFEKKIANRAYLILWRNPSANTVKKMLLM